MKIEVVSDNDAEACEYVVCLRSHIKTKFIDNEFGVCTRCGAGVQFRPTAPKGPPRICMECVADEMDESDIINITERQLEDLRKGSN